MRRASAQPRIDFQPVKTLITASGCREPVSSQRYSDQSHCPALCLLPRPSGVKPSHPRQQPQSEAVARRDEHSERPFKAGLLTAAPRLGYYRNYPAYCAV